MRKQSALLLFSSVALCGLLFVYGLYFTKGPVLAIKLDVSQFAQSAALTGGMVKLFWDNSEANVTLRKMVSNTSDDSTSVATYSSQSPVTRTLSTAREKHETNATAKPTTTSGRDSPITRKITPSNRTKVILMTYFRGGSTFLGQIMNQNPKALYWFEPLTALWYDYIAKLKKRDKINYSDLYVEANGNIRFNLPREWLEAMHKVPLSILSCNITNMDIRVLRHYMVLSWEKSEKIIPYKHCVQSRIPQGGNIQALDDSVYRQCAQLIENACMSSNIVALKTIRMPGFMAERHLQSSPDSKIIFYTRDPRGMIISQHNLQWINLVKDGMIKAQRAAYIYCGQMRHDLKKIKELSAKFPGRFLQIKYEELAQDPVELSSKIYDFIGHKVPEKLKKWIEVNTKADTRDGSLGTRRNSTEAAVKWRTSPMMTPEMNRMIYSLCSDVMQTLGYKP